MKPKIGLALASGSARGLAHIGVIKALEKNNIPIHHIAGSSIGAIIGTMYASGTSIEELENFAREIDLRKYISVLDFKFSKVGGLLGGDKLKKVFRQLLKAKTFEQCDIPVSIVTTDYIKGKEFIIDSGDLIEPMRASMSIPGIFRPVSYNGMLLIDGGMINPLPIDILIKKGCDVIIGSDIFYHPDDKRTSSPDIYEMIVGSIFLMQQEIAALRQDQIKSRRVIMVSPKIKDLSVIDFRKGKELISAGEKAAAEAMPAIQELIRPRMREKISNWLESKKEDIIGKKAKSKR